jgi:alkylhydroperoxidase/carboxymuconolactone decarboxylase family protein YurZ
MHARAIAIGLVSDGGVRSHVRRGLAEGLTADEVLHAIAIAIPTAGFPATAAAYRWATQVLGHQADDATGD